MLLIKMVIVVGLWLGIIWFLWRKMVSPLREAGRKRMVRIGLWLLLHSPLTAGMAYVAGPYFYYLFVNPLPSDAELIAHFQAHRADIETLLKMYYAAPEPKPGERRVQWDAPPEVQLIKKRAGIAHVEHAGGYWLPDPYSSEAFDILMRFDVTTPEGRFAKRQLESLHIDVDNRRYYRTTPRYPKDYLIWKTLIYIPAVAKTSDHKLWPPVTPRQTREQYERSADRILPDLTAYPPDWRKGECVYRQLETHWFIIMCRAI